MNIPLFHKVCILAAILLPSLAFAEDTEGDAIRPGVPNGTYVFQDSGVVPSPSGTLVALGGAGKLTFFPNGTTSGVVSFSAGGIIFSRVVLKGTFVVNPDGSVLETETQHGGLNITLHFDDYVSPDGNTITFVGIDAGSTVSGVSTRGH
jgi:hypothetical protein